MAYSLPVYFLDQSRCQTLGRAHVSFSDNHPQVGQRKLGKKFKGVLPTGLALWTLEVQSEQPTPPKVDLAHHLCHEHLLAGLLND